MSTNKPKQHNNNNKRSPFESGALIQAVVNTTDSSSSSSNNLPIRLYKIPYEAVLVLHDNPHPDEETYQHHIVTDKFLHLTGQEYLYLVHFFVSPDYVQFYPNENKRKNSSLHYPCVAYFMYDNSIWSSNVYKSVEDFLNDFKIVAE
jgi:hypothetical protein